MSRNTPIYILFLALLLDMVSCKPSADPDDTLDPADTGTETLASIPKSFWGPWAEIGGTTEYYISDTYVKRFADATLGIGELRFGFVSASENASAGTASVDCGSFSISARGGLFVATDKVRGSYGATVFYIAQKAPLNEIGAEVKYQTKGTGRSGARALVPAASISLVIQNALHEGPTLKVQSNGNGAFAIPDAVPGDEYKITPEAPAGTTPLSFTVVSTPGMEMSEGGIIAIPEAGVEGAFKASLEYQTSYVLSQYANLYAYHYASTPYDFKLKIDNSGTAANLESVTVAWDNAANAPLTDFGSSLAGPYAEAEAKRTPAAFQLTAANPAAGAEYIDITGTVTMTDSEGMVWLDRVAHRFYVDDTIELRLASQTASNLATLGVAATLIDPDGRTIGLSPIAVDGYSPGAGARVPRRGAGYRLAVMNSRNGNSSASDTYYSISISDYSPGADGLIRSAWISSATQPYKYDASAAASFESGEGNDSLPLSTAAREALTLRPGQSLVSCANISAGAADPDWFLVKCDLAADIPALAADGDLSLPINDSGAVRGVSDATLALDSADDPHVFYYTLTSATELKLEHSWRKSGAWSSETIVDLSSSSYVDAPPVNATVGKIAPFEISSGNWIVAFCSWVPNALDSSKLDAYPRLASGSPGGTWTAGPVPTNPDLRMNLVTTDPNALTTVPIFRRDPAGGVHLGYRRVNKDTSAEFYYSKAEGLTWSTPVAICGEVNIRTSAPRLYGFDLSGLFPVVYHRLSGIMRFQPFTSAMNIYDSVTNVSIPSDLNPDLTYFPFPNQADGRPLFVNDFRPDYRVFSSESGAGYSSFWVGSDAALPAPPIPVVQGPYRAAANEGRGIIVMDMDSYRARHFPELPLPADGGTGKARLSLALGATGKVKALMFWNNSSYTKRGYSLYEEP